MAMTIAHLPLKRGTSRRLGLLYPGLKAVATLLTEANPWTGSVDALYLRLNDGTTRVVEVDPLTELAPEYQVQRLKDPRFLHTLPIAPGWVTV